MQALLDLFMEMTSIIADKSNVVPLVDLDLIDISIGFCVLEIYLTHGLGHARKSTLPLN